MESICLRKGRRVLMIAPRFKPAIGGVEKHIEKIANELSDKGIQVDIMTSRHQADLNSVDEVNNHQVFRLPYGWDKNPFLSSLWIIKNRRFFQQYGTIHVHDTIPLLFWSLPFLILKPRKRVFITFHGFERDPIPLVFKILRHIARRIISKAICIGKFIEREYAIRCESCTIGAVDSFHSENRERSGLVYVGRLEKDTGVIQSLEVLYELEQHGFKTPLTICGTGSLEDSLKQMAKEKNLDVRFEGMVKNVIPYFERSFICLAGGFLSILEAMSSGAPVIAHAKTRLKRSYFESVIEAGGIISIQTCVEGVAREIMKIKENDDFYNRISSKGRKFASKMTWKHLAEKYISLWEMDN